MTTLDTGRLQCLDRKQTSSLLRVNIRTLQRMERRGELKPRRIGGSVRYLATDIASLVGMTARGAACNV